MDKHTTITANTIINALIITVFLLTAIATPAFAHDPIKCWVAADYDTDGDGFADFFAHKNDRVTLYDHQFTDAEHMTCPAGYVMARGDVDDSDPSVRPRRQEVAFNDIDDDGDGRIDEPTIYYSRTGYSNTNTGFTMKVRIHDERVISYFQSPYWDVLARIEYQKLQDTSITRTRTRTVTSMNIYSIYSQTNVRLTGLEQGTVYRARVRFIARYKTNHSYKRNVGPKSTWYFTMTDADHRKVKARKRIVLRALYEKYLSERRYTGYLGTHRDGTRYGGDVGEWWCSEYYSWVTNFELEDMGHRSNTRKLREYYEDRGGWADLPDDQTYLIGFAGAGDYLGIGDDPNNMGHSAMFLEYEPARDIVWSVEGNVSGRSDIGGGYASRRGGNETRVVQRGSDTIAGVGMIQWGMVRD